MVDRQKLGTWIQPKHLEESALEGYRSAFAGHPAHLVVIKDFLQPQMAERLSRFLSNEAEFKVTYGLYSTEVAVSEEEFTRAKDEDRLFKLRRLVGTPPQFQTSPNALTYLQFRVTFQRPEFKAFFEAVSGIPLATSDDFGAQSMTEGDFLRPHSDDNRDRQIAIVIYLSQGWKPENGGQLRVVHLDGKTTVVEAEYNSMIAFNVLTHSAHVVEPVRSLGDSTKRRVTIGGWYHKPT
ncbi:MAG TPA: 2OG-Fe(II) oxygenase family protein [Gemmatimonadaceae bacterium]|nr:2OG-Fe(II) oxygenase family protein [Gemmatimonadaceae bacterium]